jgi:hypothetical protein
MIGASKLYFYSHVHILSWMSFVLLLSVIFFFLFQVYHYLLLHFVYDTVAIIYLAFSFRIEIEICIL